MISATFLAIFPAFGLNFRSCFGDFCSFSYFSRNFSGFWAEFQELFLRFLQFQLLFLAIFPAFRLNFGCCFKSFRDYSSPGSAYYAINLWLLYIMPIQDPLNHIISITSFIVHIYSLSLRPRLPLRFLKIALLTAKCTIIA